MEIAPILLLQKLDFLGKKVRIFNIFIIYSFALIVKNLIILKLGAQKYLLIYAKKNKGKKKLKNFLKKFK